MATGDITALDSVQKINDGDSSRWYSLTKLSDGKMMSFSVRDFKAKAQVINCDPASYEMIPEGTALAVGGVATAFHTTSVVVSSSAVFGIWAQNRTSGKACLLSIDGSDVVTANSSTVFASSITTNNGARMGLTQLATDLFVVGYYTYAAPPYVKLKLLEVDSSTLATSSVGSGSTITTSGGYGSGISVSRVDDTHVVVFYERGDDKGVARVYEVNTSTGAFTALGTDLIFHNFTTALYYTDSKALGSNKFILSWYGGNKLHARVIEVNTSTWQASFAGSEFDVTSSGGYNSAMSVYDTDKFAILYRTTANEGHMKTLQIDGSDEISRLSLYAPTIVDGTKWCYGGLVKFKDGYVASAWQGDEDFLGDSDTEGHMRAFSIETGVIPPSTSTKTQII